MPRTSVPIQTIPRNGAISNVAWTPADQANGHMFDNGGDVMLLAKCTDANGKTVTVKSVADEAGRTGDLAITVGATNGYSIAGPFRPRWWNQLADIGKVYVDVSAATGLSLAAVRFEPR